MFYNVFRKMSPSLHKNSHLPRNIFLVVRVKVIFRAKKKKKLCKSNFATYKLWKKENRRIRLSGMKILIQNHQDSLFLFFILVNISTYFGHTYCP